MLKQLNVKPREYVLVRYISYDAHHDLVANPLDVETKKEIVIRIASQYKVFVSLESSISDSGIKNNNEKSINEYGASCPVSLL